MGVGEAVADKKVLENAVGDMQKIAGQKPVVTKSRKSIAGFKIRDGYPIGCMVTLRGPQMFEFLDRLVTIACRVSAISVASRARVSMAVATTTWASRNRSSSRKSSTTRSMRCADEHQHHHDREDRRGSQGAARRLQVPVQELRRTWRNLH